MPALLMEAKIGDSSSSIGLKRDRDQDDRNQERKAPAPRAEGFFAHGLLCEQNYDEGDEEDRESP